MFGMEVMTEAMSPLADMPEFTHVLTAFANPILGVIVGTIVTAVIQSSAASIGILQALSMVGGITYGMAIPIVMGQISVLVFLQYFQVLELIQMLNV